MQSNELTFEQAVINVDSWIKYCLGIGAFKSFEETDAMRESVLLINRIYLEKVSRITKLETEIKLLTDKIEGHGKSEKNDNGNKTEAETENN